MNSREFPIFSGDNPLFWIEAMEDLFEELQVPWESYVDMATRYLRGSARHLWFFDDSIFLEKDWCGFSYKLLGKFAPSTKVFEEEESELIDEVSESEEDPVALIREHSLEEFDPLDVVTPFTGKSSSFELNPDAMYSKMFQFDFSMRYKWSTMEHQFNYANSDCGRGQVGVVMAGTVVGYSQCGKWDYPFQLYDEMLEKHVSFLKVLILDDKGMDDRESFSNANHVLDSLPAPDADWPFKTLTHIVDYLCVLLLYENLISAHCDLQRVLQVTSQIVVLDSLNPGQEYIVHWFIGLLVEYTQLCLPCFSSEESANCILPNISTASFKVQPCPVVSIHGWDNARYSRQSYLLEYIQAPTENAENCNSSKYCLIERWKLMKCTNGWLLDMVWCEDNIIYMVRLSRLFYCCLYFGINYVIVTHFLGLQLVHHSGSDIQFLWVAYGVIFSSEVAVVVFCALLDFKEGTGKWKSVSTITELDSPRLAPKIVQGWPPWSYSLVQELFSMGGNPPTAVAVTYGLNKRHWIIRRQFLLVIGTFSALGNLLSNFPSAHGGVFSSSIQVLLPPRVPTAYGPDMGIYTSQLPSGVVVVLNEGGSAKKVLYSYGISDTFDTGVFDPGIPDSVVCEKIISRFVQATTLASMLIQEICFWVFINVDYKVRCSYTLNSQWKFSSRAIHGIVLVQLNTSFPTHNHPVLAVVDTRRVVYPQGVSRTMLQMLNNVVAELPMADTILMLRLQGVIALVFDGRYCSFKVVSRESPCILISDEAIELIHSSRSLARWACYYPDFHTPARYISFYDGIPWGLHYKRQFCFHFVLGMRQFCYLFGLVNTKNRVAFLWVIVGSFDGNYMAWRHITAAHKNFLGNGVFPNIILLECGILFKNGVMLATDRFMVRNLYEDFAGNVELVSTVAGWFLWSSFLHFLCGWLCTFYNLLGPHGRCCLWHALRDELKFCMAKDKNTELLVDLSLFICMMDNQLENYTLYSYSAVVLGRNLCRDPHISALPIITVVEFSLVFCQQDRVTDTPILQQSSVTGGILQQFYRLVIDTAVYNVYPTYYGCTQGKQLPLQWVCYGNVTDSLQAICLPIPAAEYLFSTVHIQDTTSSTSLRTRMFLRGRECHIPIGSGQHLVVL